MLSPPMIYFFAEPIQKNIKVDDHNQIREVFGDIKVYQFIEIFIFDDGVDGQNLHADHEGAKEKMRFEHIFSQNIKDTFEEQRV